MGSLETQNILGRILGGIAVAESLRSPGGLLNSLALRNRLQTDPTFQQSASPFMAGVAGVGTKKVPGRATNPAEEQRAGLTPEQAQQLGVGVLGPGENPVVPPERVLNFPRSNQVQQLAQNLATVTNEYLGNLPAQPPGGPTGGGTQAPSLMGVAQHRLGLGNQPDYNALFQAAQAFGFVPTGLQLNAAGNPMPTFGYPPLPIKVQPGSTFQPPTGLGQRGTITSPKPVLRGNVGENIPPSVQVSHDVTQQPMSLGDRTAIGQLQTYRRAATQLMTEFTPEERMKYAGAYNYAHGYGNQFLSQFGVTKADPKFARFVSLVGELRSSAFGEGGKNLTGTELSVVQSYTPTGRELGGPVEFESKLSTAVDRIDSLINQRYQNLGLAPPQSTTTTTTSTQPPTTATTTTTNPAVQQRIQQLLRERQRVGGY